jgi:hypothetical protein
MALGSVLLLALAALAATSFSPEKTTTSPERSLRSTRAVESQLRPPRGVGSGRRHHATTTEEPTASHKSDERHHMYVDPETGLREAFFKRCGSRCEGFGNTDCKCDRFFILFI